MAGTANLKLTGSVVGSGNSANLAKAIGPLEINNTVSGDAVLVQTLSSGFNTITVPPGGTFKGCIIIPPSGNTVTLTLKGVTGDTGVPIHVTDWTYLAFPTSTTAFGITTNGTVAPTFIFI